MAAKKREHGHQRLIYFHHKMVNFGACYLEEQVRCEGRRSWVSEATQCTAVHMAIPPGLAPRAWVQRGVGAHQGVRE